MGPTDPQTPPPTPPSQPLYPPQGPLNPPQPPQMPPQQPPQFQQQFNQRSAQAQGWFRGLPTWGKVVSIIGGIVLVCMLCGLCSAIGSAFTNAAAGGSHANGAQNTAAPKGPTSTKGPAPTATANVPHFGDGSFQVGKDVQPGTYRTRVASSGCYWQRLKGFDGTFEEIISNGNENGPAVVTISANDKGFSSQDCGTWTQDLSQITKSKTSFDEGVFIVGTDLDAGTYKSDGGDNCYWERLRDFSGAFGGIIANGNPKGAAIVTIKASDKGFHSADCGTWTKQ